MIAPLRSTSTARRGAAPTSPPGTSNWSAASHSLSGMLYVNEEEDMAEADVVVDKVEDPINQEADKAAEAGKDEAAVAADDKKVEAAADDGKAADEKGGEKVSTLLADAEGDEADGKEGVPDKYEFTPPEGFEVNEGAQKAFEAFGETAREMGLTQAQYQQLIEYDIERGQAATEAAATGYVERITGWAEQVRSDKELGGEALQENLGVAKQAIEAFGSSELRKLIAAPSTENPEGLGLGNHPEFIRFMYRVGKSIGEGKLIEGDASQSEDGDALKRMYPSMFQKAG
jgi:hypothetical protein